MENKSILKPWLDLFFPNRCVCCKDVVECNSVLCVCCSHRLAYTHWNFDDDNYAFHKIRNLCKIEKAFSMLHFENESVAQKLIHNLKYKNRPEIGFFLADKLNDLQKIKNFDGLIPIPIHPKKEKLRGYNQVMSFTQRLSELSGIPLLDDFLLRIENTKSQTRKDRNKRLNSIKNAFEVKNKNLKGRYILIDDVLTTGATISTCVNLIHEKNEVELSVITMACAY